ncbi:hypothetical protein MRX96_000960 [Rhipicephalus microplus]
MPSCSVPGCRSRVMRKGTGRHLPCQTSFPQQRGGGAGTVATAQQDTKPEMTALSSTPEASLQQQEPVDVADSLGSPPSPSRQLDFFTNQEGGGTRVLTLFNVNQHMVYF